MKYRKVTSGPKPDQVATEAYKQKADDIIFEAKPSILGGSFQDHLILLYGPPKIGKSKMFSLFPGVYFLPTEPAYRALNIRKTAIPNWVTFRKFIIWAETHPNRIRDVQIWCVDTVTNLSKFCMQWVCGREGISHPSDQEWGKGWEAFSDEFNYWICRLGNIGKGVAFIAHSNTIEIISRSMRVTKSAPDIPKTCYRIINNMCDIILEMSFVKAARNLSDLGEQRCLYTKPTEVRDAGDRTGRLPDVITFRTEQQAVRKILNCFRKE